MWGLGSQSLEDAKRMNMPDEEKAKLAAVAMALQEDREDERAEPSDNDGYRFGDRLHPDGK
jgi:hypothetical protein